MSFILKEIIHDIFLIYTLMILIRIIASWFPEISRHRILLFIQHYTDPYLNLFRRFIPPLGMIDLSPMFSLIFLQILEYVINLFL